MSICECQNLMTKIPEASGQINFICNFCHKTIVGTDDDTLIAEGFLDYDINSSKYNVFIENSYNDPAGNIILRDCKKCGLYFMTIIKIGENQNTMYTCSCGNIEQDN